MTPTHDPEPDLIRQLPPEVAPTLHEVNKVFFEPKEGSKFWRQRDTVWHAWITDWMRPCDWAMLNKIEPFYKVVLHCLLCVCLLAQKGLVLDDYSFYNFGVLDGRVKTIDFGCNTLNEFLLRKHVTSALSKFWSKAAEMKPYLALTPEEENDYLELHNWFRFDRWADTRVLMATIIDELRVRVDRNPLGNVAPRPSLRAAGSSRGHSTSSEPSPQRQRNDELRVIVDRNPLGNVAPRASLRAARSSGGDPTSSEPSPQRQCDPIRQEYVHLEQAALQECGCKSNAFWDIQTIRSGLIVRRAENLLRTSVTRYTREGWINWFAENAFRECDMDWVVPSLKQDFAVSELRNKATNNAQRRGNWKAHLMQTYGRYQLFLLMIRMPLKDVTVEDIKGLPRNA